MTLSEQHNSSDIASPDDKIMAALGHATIIWPVMGIIAPLVIWATQREKSRFLAFQALQAVMYHMTLIIAGFACGVCYFCSYVGMIFGAMAMPFSAIFTVPQAGGDMPPEALIPFFLGFLGMFVLYVAIFGLMFLGLAVWAAYIGYGLYGAVANLRGKDFRYAILGSRLERYLESAPAKPGTTA
jgi:uncharacterized Tic20 family protein